MNSGKGGVGIPVNVGGSSNVNIGIQGGVVNVPQKVPNNSNNVDTNNKPTMSPIMTNNQNTSNGSPKNSNMANNIHTNNNNNNNNNNSNNNNNNSNSNNNNNSNNNTNATTNSISNTNSVDINTITNKSLSPTEIQQRQKLLLQQKALQQQQSMQNFENQFFQLLMTLNKKPKRIYNFVEETDLILQKYEQYRPSFEFHIYEDKFKICAPSNSRFQQQQQTDNNQTNSLNVNNKNNNNQRTNTVHNDGLILEKDDQTLKEFLEYVARGRIPEAIMEVLRDSNIQFYESNLILQVYDHTNTVEVTISRPVNRDSMNNSLPNNMQGDVSNTQIQNQQALNKQIRKFRRPRVYRTLLRPNDLTNYYDMMTYADQARFSDSIYQQFESEILSLTKRNIKLDVDLNPFEHREKIDEDEFCEPRFNENTKAMEFVHKEESTEDGTKGKVGHIPEHEEMPQSISNYEQLMLIMSERTSTITKSTLATSLAEVSKKQNSNDNNNNGLETSRNSSISLNSIPGSSSGGFKSSGLTTTANNTNLTNLTTATVLSKAKSTTTSSSEKSNNENTRFSRLKFIEQWKINVEKRKQQMVLNNNDNNGNGLPDYLVLGTPFMTKISMTIPMTPQAQLLQQQEQFQKFQQQQQQQQQPIQTKEKKITGKGIKHGASGANEKPKAKRTKKTKKDTDGAQQTPKRKRVSKKKQAAADSSNNITAASPKSQPASNISTPI